MHECVQVSSKKKWGGKGNRCMLVLLETKVLVAILSRYLFFFPSQRMKKPFKLKVLRNNMCECPMREI